MKTSMRVLHIAPDGSETIHACTRATQVGENVYIYGSDVEAVQVSDGEVLVLSDDGRMAHKWTLGN